MKHMELSVEDVIGLLQREYHNASGNVYGLEFERALYLRALRNLHEQITDLKTEKEGCKCQQH